MAGLLVRVRQHRTDAGLMKLRQLSRDDNRGLDLEFGALHDDAGRRAGGIELAILNANDLAIGDSGGAARVVHRADRVHLGANGDRADDVHLEFKGGVLVNSHSVSNQEFLQEILNMDEGASRIGEFGVGTNFGIDRFVYDILYDEKIGGTIHIALGRAYEEAGGKNYSALHWDLVKDLREEGEILLDGEKVFENGKFLF